MERSSIIITLYPFFFLACSMGAVGLVVAFMIVLLIDGMYKVTTGHIDWGEINWGPTSFEDVFLSIPIMSFA